MTVTLGVKRRLPLVAESCLYQKMFLGSSNIFAVYSISARYQKGFKGTT